MFWDGCARILYKCNVCSYRFGSWEFQQAYPWKLHAVRHVQLCEPVHDQCHVVMYVCTCCQITYKLQYMVTHAFLQHICTQNYFLNGLWGPGFGFSKTQTRPKPTISSSVALPDTSLWTSGCLHQTSLCFHPSRVIRYVRQGEQSIYWQFIREVLR